MIFTKIIKKLSWNDFKGIPESFSNFDACINWGIYYNYTIQEKCINPNTSNEILHSKIAKVNLNVSCRMLETSWYIKGKETEHLLIHEFGHLLIAYLFAENFVKDVEKKFFPLEKIDEALKKVFNDIFEECVEYQNKYDKDTNHSLNKEIQKKWNEELNGRVNENGYKIMI